MNGAGSPIFKGNSATGAVEGKLRRVAHRDYLLRLRRPGSKNLGHPLMFAVSSFSSRPNKTVNTCQGQCRGWRDNYEKHKSYQE